MIDDTDRLVINALTRRIGQLEERLYVVRLLTVAACVLAITAVLLAGGAL